MIVYTELELFLQDVQDELPHGAGINYDWSSRFREISPGIGIAAFSCKYEQDGGYGYSDAIDFTAYYSFDLATRYVQFRGIACYAEEQIVYDEEGEYDGLDLTLDYLHQCFADTEIKL